MTMIQKDNIDDKDDQDNKNDKMVDKNINKKMFVSYVIDDYF